MTCSSFSPTTVPTAFSPTTAPTISAPTGAGATFAPTAAPTGKCNPATAFQTITLA